MITNLRVYNDSNQYIDIPLNGQDSSYFIKNIDGLGPTKADVKTEQHTIYDGGSFTMARRTSRNIVMRLGLNPSYSTSDPYGALRRGLYPYLSTSSKVVLVFTNSNMATVSIDGWVESFDAVMFSKEPEVNISIMCPEPHFIGSRVTVSTAAGFNYFSVTNPGDVETGFTMLIDGYNLTGTTPKTLEIGNDSLSLNNKLYITTATGAAYENFYIVTETGLRDVRRSIRTTQTPRLDPYALFNGASWMTSTTGTYFKIKPGTANMHLFGGYGSTLLATLFFYPKYLGL